MRIHGRKFKYLDHYHRDDGTLVEKTIYGKVQKTKTIKVRLLGEKVKFRFIILGFRKSIIVEAVTFLN